MPDPTPYRAHYSDVLLDLLRESKAIRSYREGLVTRKYAREFARYLQEAFLKSHERVMCC